MTNVRELVCLPDAFDGRDYINVTNPLASGDERYDPSAPS
jgi:hypothetical protein